MWENRAQIIKKKPKIILDNKQFPVTAGLNLGDKGQLLLGGSIDSERLEFQEDDNERIIKTVRVLSIELIQNRQTRI